MQWASLARVVPRQTDNVVGESSCHLQQLALTVSCFLTLSFPPSQQAVTLDWMYRMAWVNLYSLDPLVGGLQIGIWRLTWDGSISTELWALELVSWVFELLCKTLSASKVIRQIPPPLWDESW